jgi:ATP sulfurylase
MKALEDSKSDAIFISPVTGAKKSGDFLALPIIECYNALIRSNFYGSYGTVIGAFDTYSRYCGPREAAFTAICRKNFGCNCFIVGRDHAGVGDYYAPDASLKIFDSLDLGINILTFDPVSFVNGEVALGGSSCSSDGQTVKPISGSAVRDCLVRGEEIPDYLMRKQVSKILHDMIKHDAASIFQA